MADLNNSTNAINKQMVIPDVYSSLVREKIAGKVIVSQATEVKGDLKGKPEETLTFTAWSYIGDSKDIQPGTPMESTKMKQTTKQATIKMVAAPVVSKARLAICQWNILLYRQAIHKGLALDIMKSCLK